MTLNDNRLLLKEAAAQSGSGSSKYGDLDREDTQVLQEAGVKLGGPDEGMDRSGGGDESGDEGRYEAEVS